MKKGDTDDGHVADVTTVEARRLRELAEEVRELRRINERQVDDNWHRRLAPGRSNPLQYASCMDISAVS